MKRFLHFVFSQSPLVLFLVLFAFLFALILLVRLTFFTEQWVIVVQKNGSGLVGHLTDKGDFVRLSDVYVLKKQSLPPQESWTSSFILRADIDPGFSIERFDLDSVLISRSDIASIVPVSSDSLIVKRIDQILYLSE